MSPGPSGGVFTRFIHHGPGSAPGSFPVAPILPGTVQSDRTPGLPSTAGRLRPGRVNEVYSDEPPSNRTSTSRCIRLYGSTPWRVVNSAPFRRLVRPTPRVMPPISKTPVQLQAADDRDRLDRFCQCGSELPGVDSEQVVRAGYARVRSVAEMTISWKDNPPQLQSTSNMKYVPSTRIGNLSVERLDDFLLPNYLFSSLLCFLAT